MYKMRRPAAILILLLVTSCRFSDSGKRLAADAVLQTVMHLQASAPLTQSAARTPAVRAHSRACRLIASPEILRRDAKRTVELCRRVLPRHDFRQLYDLVLVVERANARKKLVRHIAARGADGVCKFQDGPFFG